MLGQRSESAQAICARTCILALRFEKNYVVCPHGKSARKGMIRSSRRRRRVVVVDSAPAPLRLPPPPLRPAAAIDQACT
eukprot:8328042-Pyramimonas_sp.AAC.1